MNALYQQLKEIDPKKFEQFCLHLLKERHPGADIKHVDGTSGDEGIDCFAGEIDGNLFVWQCKSFPDGIKEPQKEQIRKSLRRAAEHPNLQAWILCLPVDLDTKAHRWFERLKASYEDKFKIGLLEAGQITHELMHRRTLQEAYFPCASLNATELRSLITRTGELSDTELASLTTENVHQYIQRLKDRDARFTYEINFGGDRGPQLPTTRPGLLVTVTNGDKRIDVFARDLEALQLNPLRVSFTATGAGVEKVNEAIRTGRPQQLGPGEIASFNSDLAFLAGDGPHAPMSLDILPGPVKPRIPMRMTFGTGSEALVYDYVEFQVARQGTEEAELVSTGNLPFEFHFILDKSEIQISFESHFANADVRSIQKIMRAVSIARMTGYFELYDLRLEKHIRGNISGLPEWESPFQRLIDESVLVADRYNIQLRLPPTITQQDAENLSVLKQLANGGLAVSGDLSVTIVKGTENKDALRRLLSGSDVGIRLERPGYEPTPTLFGGAIATGPIVGQADKARLKNPDQAKKAYDAAEEGDDLELVLEHANKFLFKLLA